MLRIQKANGDFLYSAFVSDRIANINPLSTVALGEHSEIQVAGTDLNALYPGYASFSSGVTSDALDRVTSTVYGQLTRGLQGGVRRERRQPDLCALSDREREGQGLRPAACVPCPKSGSFEEKNASPPVYQAFGTSGSTASTNQLAGRHRGTFWAPR